MLQPTERADPGEMEPTRPEQGATNFPRGRFCRRQSARDRRDQSGPGGPDRAGDRLALEGNNQKQADFLSRTLADVDPQKIHDLHLLISSISRREHLTLFERDIARKVDFAFAGPQSLRVAQLLEDGKLEIGAIHTYVELYARMLRGSDAQRRPRSRRKGRPRPEISIRAPTPRTRRPSSRRLPSGMASSSLRSMS